jgi:hypothetical protein
LELLLVEVLDEAIRNRLFSRLIGIKFYQLGDG